jgi:polyisoprenoid-binding protein YceI
MVTHSQTLRKTRLAFAALMFVALSTGSSANPASYKKDVAKSKIGFIAHTTLFDVDGHFKAWTSDVKIDPKDLSLTRFNVKVSTNSVDTGIDKRDEHLKENDFFNSDKYPHAQFTSTTVQITSKNTLAIHGTLTIRDKTQKVMIPAKFSWIEKMNGRALRLTGKIQIIRQDFDINYKSSLLLPSVEKEVDITFDVTVLPTENN